MLIQQIDTAHEAFAVRDTKELNPLQMAYVGDTLHDLYVRSLLVGRGMTVGAMHKQAVRMVSAFAQARMMEAIEPELTPAEADVARRGRNSQAKHAAPKHADPADYAHATGLDALIRLALERTEDIWQKRTSR